MCQIRRRAKLINKSEINDFKNWNHEFTRINTKNSAYFVLIRVISWFTFFRFSANLGRLIEFWQNSSLIINYRG
jgi:hypothetical protein